MWITRVQPSSESEDGVRAVLVAEQQLIVLAGVHFWLAIFPIQADRRCLYVSIL